MAEQSPVIGEAETVERVDNTSDMTGPGDNIPDTNSTPPVAAVPAIVLPAPSKKYLKKMAKHAKYEVIKKLKRKAEKEKMKLKRLQARENGTISLMPITRKILLKTVAPIDFDAVSARVVIDCSFDQHMTKDEKTKTCKQLLRVYTLNRRAPRPMPVYFCGLKEGTEMMEIFKKNDGYEHWDIKVQEPTYLEQFPKERLVYLTSDSDNILGELNQDDVYVIGGLVDHNRYKGICHDTATEKGIRHARLPIKENILLKCRTVLTIEQVFDMILRVYNGADWKSTLLEVVPKRKGAVALSGESKTTTIPNNSEQTPAAAEEVVAVDSKSEGMQMNPVEGEF